MRLNSIHSQNTTSSERPNEPDKRNIASINAIEQCSSTIKTEGCCKSLLETLQNLWKSFLDFILCRKKDKESSKSENKPVSKKEELKPKEEEKVAQPRNVTIADLRVKHPRTHPFIFRTLEQNPHLIQKNLSIAGVPSLIRLQKIDTGEIIYHLFMRNPDGSQAHAGTISISMNDILKLSEITFHTNFSGGEFANYKAPITQKQLEVASALIRHVVELHDKAGMERMDVLGIQNYAAIFRLNGFYATFDGYRNPAKYVDASMINNGLDKEKLKDPGYTDEYVEKARKIMQEEMPDDIITNSFINAFWWWDRPFPTLYGDKIEQQIQKYQIGKLQIDQIDLANFHPKHSNSVKMVLLPSSLEIWREAIRTNGLPHFRH